MKAILNFEPMLLWCRPHTSLQAKSSCSNSPCKWQRSCSAQTSNLPPVYDKEQTSSLTSLEARWSTEQASSNTQCFTLFTRECVSMATLICAHGTTILTNYEPSELIAECIFCVLQARTWTIAI